LLWGDFLRKLSLLVLICFIISINAYAISAQSFVLMDASSGRILTEQNAHIKRGMASTTKIMTAIVAIENGNPDSVVTVSKNAAYVEGSSMWLKEGEKITLESLLYGLMLNSGNDAATAIAEHIGGTIENFAVMMNNKAKELGLKNTSFANPHGLDNENHYTTAYELGVITCYALNNEFFNEIVNTKRKTIEGLENGLTRTLKNHNKMLTLYDSADGVKTGFTKKCGRCLVSSATQDGLRLIAVTLNAPDDWNDHIQMFNFGFSKYQVDLLLNKDSYIKTIDVSGGTSDYVQTYITKSLSIAVTGNEKPVIVYNVPETLNAPVYARQKVGTVHIELGGKEYLKADVIAKNGVCKRTKTGIQDSLFYLAMELLSYFKTAV